MILWDLHNYSVIYNVWVNWECTNSCKKWMSSDSQDCQMMKIDMGNM